MQKALEALPWVSKADVDFAKRQVTVTVESKRYEAEALTKALKDAGFGGELVKSDKKQAGQLPSVTFRVIGMKKTQSGAT